MLPVLIVVAISGLLVVFYIRQQSRRAARASLRGWPLAPNPEARKRMLDKHSQLRDLCTEMRDNAKARITVADIMTRSVAAVAENASIEEVATAMQSQCTRHLVVQDRAGQPVGVVSDRDIFREGSTARAIMTPNPVTVASSSTLGNAVALMLNNRISCLPVVDDELLCGIVTTTDMLMVLECFVDYFEQEHHASGASTPPGSWDEMLQTMIA